MSRNQITNSDVVKKGLLKYRASKVKGTSGSSAQGPKSSKSTFIVFRAIHHGEKVLHLYTSEKKFHEMDDPKWEVYLRDATSVYFLSDKKSFCIAMSDGGLLFMDAISLTEAEEWVRCFNAVLYAKGIDGEETLQYEVEMVANSILDYFGPSILELRDHDLIIWNNTSDEIVRWKLNHLRSFKAKKHNLTIISGNRSCTGLGEFVFKSSHSVQITHAIETVVAKVKYRSSPSPSPNVSRQQSPNMSSRETTHPSASIPGIIPDMRDPSGEHLSVTSVVESIPNFASSVYDIPEDIVQEEYGKLDHNSAITTVVPNQLQLKLANGCTRKMNHDNGPCNSPPNQLSPSQDDDLEGYGKLDHNHLAKNLRSSPPKIVAPVNNDRKSSYEDIDFDLSNQEEIFGKLERNVISQTSVPPKEPRARSKSPIRRNPPQKPLPYASDSKSKQLKPPIPSQKQVSNHNETQEEYGKLDHGQNPVATGHFDVYEVIPEGGSILDHGVQAVASDHYDTIAENGLILGNQNGTESDNNGAQKKREEFGGRKKQRSLEEDRHMVLEGLSRQRLHHTVRGQLQRSENQEAYGKLNHVTAENRKSSRPVPMPKPASLLSPQEEYGHLDRNLRHSTFDPYGTIPSDTYDPECMSIKSNSSVDSIQSGKNDTAKEETSQLYSEVKKPVKKPEQKEHSNRNTHQTAPPPGYDNFVPLNLSSTQPVANSSPKNGQPPVVPPRHSQRTTIIKHPYQNIGEVLVTPHGNTAEVSLDLDLQQESAIANNSTASSKPPTAPRPKTRPKPKRS